MNKYKKYMIISLIILVITIICTTGTYAWFTWSNPSNTNLTLTIGNIDVLFDISPDINITNLSPVLYPEEGVSTTFSLKKNNNSLGNIEYTITLDITTISDELKDTSFKWLLKQEDTILTSGDFSTSSNNSSITLYTGTLTDTNTLSYTLYIYIDGNNENNPNMMNKSLTGTINISGKEKETFAKYITNLYTNSDKSEVKNNSITYNYASSVSLMNDRLGGTTEDYDAGNIRYYGASPNNYIYFNCSDYSNQNDTTCELWRIIGVFDGKVKLIRNESIGSYSWDNKPSGVGTSTSPDGSNKWTDSRLMIMLNPTDYSSSFGTDIYAYDKGSYWYGLSSTCYAGSSSGTKTCDFTSIGFKNDTTRNLISTETYYINGYNNSSVYSNFMYKKERAGNTWNGKIALAYPSDYGYAADFNYCTQNLYSYSNSTCTSNNWMKSILGPSSYGWLLTHYSSSAIFAWCVYSSGYVYHSSTPYPAYVVAPVLYLNSNIEISNIGDGSSDNPYQISI